MNVDELIDAEEQRQLDLWGEQNHPDGTYGKFSILADAARSECEEAFENGHGAWKHIAMEEMFEAFAEEDEDKLIVELVQTAAVIKSWLKAIDRRQNEVAA